MSKKDHFISIKALLIGFLLCVITNLLLVVFSFYYLGWVAENMGPVPVGTLTEELMKNPFVILFSVFELIFGAALPGYITAFIAKKNYTLHGVILAVIVVSLDLLQIEDHNILSLFIITWVVLNIAATIIAAWYRGFQVNKKEITKYQLTSG